MAEHASNFTCFVIVINAGGLSTTFPDRKRFDIDLADRASTFLFFDHSQEVGQGYPKFVF